jgi:hypothetical protein
MICKAYRQDKQRGIHLWPTLDYKMMDDYRKCLMGLKVMALFSIWVSMSGFQGPSPGTYPFRESWNFPTAEWYNERDCLACRIKIFRVTKKNKFFKYTIIIIFKKNLYNGGIEIEKISAFFSTDPFFGFHHYSWCKTESSTAGYVD